MDKPLRISPFITVQEFVGDNVFQIFSIRQMDRERLSNPNLDVEYLKGHTSNAELYCFSLSTFFMTAAFAIARMDEFNLLNMGVDWLRFLCNKDSALGHPKHIAINLNGLLLVMSKRGSSILFGCQRRLSIFLILDILLVNLQSIYENISKVELEKKRKGQCWHS